MIIVDEAGRTKEIRWTARRKASLVLDVLAGASLDDAARTSGIDVTSLGAWRDQFVRSGTAGLKGYQPESGPVQ